MDVGLLSVEGAVFHQVPTKGALVNDGAAPVLSTAESSLDAQLQAFLRDRLTRTFAQAMQPVRRDPDTASPTPDLVTIALSTVGDPDIVSPFALLPSLLLEVQAHNSPQGLLAIVRGSCGPNKVVILMKVEHERGLSFETTTVNGQTRVEVVIENDLVLTDKTEVFKAAIFYLDQGDLAGYVTDEQSGSAARGPSHYWLSDFLGCEWANDVDVLTLNWIKAIERVVRSDIADPAHKSALTSALHAELTSNRSTITPQNFIADHVPPAVQDAARQRLSDHGVPLRRFPKSAAIAQANARATKKIRFESGVVVTMPIGTEPEITPVELANGGLEHVLTVRGKIRSVD